MTKDMKTALIVGLSIAAAGAVLCGVARHVGANRDARSGANFWWGLNVGSTRTNTSDYGDFDNDYSASGNYETAVDGIENVSLKWAAGSVIVRAGDGDKVTFSEKTAGDISKDKALRWAVKDGTLCIQYCQKDVTFRLPQKELTLTVPAELAAKLSGFTIGTVSATVDAQGVSAGRFEFNTASGDLNAVLTAKSVKLNTVSGDIDYSGDCENLEINSTSGDVRYEGTVTSAEANTVSGGVELFGSCGSADANTISGDLGLSSAVCPKKLSFNTTSGEAKLKLPADSGFTLSMSSVSGDFNCNFPTVRQDSKYVAGDGSASFEVNSVSGDVQIEKG